jgi:Flp pilus assembly protein TadD
MSAARAIAFPCCKFENVSVWYNRLAIEQTTRGKKHDAAQLLQSDTANANANIHHRCAIVIVARLRFCVVNSHMCL